MPTPSEKNQFRRLIGDYGVNAISDTEIQTWLDDTTFELTSEAFVDTNGVSGAIISFDGLFIQYHREVLYKAAINWWWQKASTLADHHTTTIGAASQNVSEKWDRAMQMIQQLEVTYNEIQQLGIDITQGNLSRWSKGNLTRIGGISEEEALKNAGF